MRDTPAANQPSNAQHPTGVLTTRQQQYMAIFAIIGIAALITYAIAFPEVFNNTLAQFFFCVAVATLLSIFFFVFYPERHELRKIPLIGLPVKVAGPIVLWVIVLVLLLNWIPEGTVQSNLRRADLMRITGQESISNCLENTTIECRNRIVAARMLEEDEKFADLEKELISRNPSDELSNIIAEVDRIVTGTSKPDLSSQLSLVIRYRP